MAMKGQKYRYWTGDEKYNIIKPVLNFEKGIRIVAKENNIDKGMIGRWVRTYNQYGIQGLNPKRKPGNLMAKYHTKKNFDSKEEQLEYEIMKLRIENERLKKGYLVKGDGSIVVFKK